jgi:hypothetical protein
VAIYYFDFRDGEELVIDEEGLELRDLVAVQNEAARALAGLAWDEMRVDRSKGKGITIEVRDVYGPVMEVKFAFEIKRKQ